MFMLKPTRHLYSAYHHQQRGFVLLSVLLTAIIIGIIALYNARITQAEVQAQQIERTTQRMQQWLLAALAYRYKNSDWPITLDYARNSSDPTPSKNALNYDLVGNYFMPSAIEDVSPSAKYAIAQSPTDTSWTQDSHYLIKRDFIDPQCYSNSVSSSDQYATKCKLDPDGPFKIVAQVPTKQIAEQIAAKLPASYIDNYQNGDYSGYNVHVYVKTTGIGSKGDTVSSGSFVSGFLPLPDTSGDQGRNQVISNASTTGSWQVGGKHAYIGIPLKLKGGNDTDGARNYVGTQDHNLSGKAYKLIYSPDQSQSKKTYGHLSYIELIIADIPYSWDSQAGKVNKIGKYQCDNRHKKHDKTVPAPNIAVSTSGFNAPVVSQYSFSTYYVPYKRANTNSDILWASFGYECSSLDSQYACPDFFPYSSVYGLMTMSFGEKNQDNSYERYEYFLIQAVGLSTQARGANNKGSESPSKDNDDFKDYLVLHEFSASGIDDEYPTKYNFPADKSGSNEPDNNDHIWSIPTIPMSTSDPQPNNWDTFDGTPTGQPYQSGIDGINFFFVCNGAYID